MTPGQGCRIALLILLPALTWGCAGNDLAAQARGIRGVIKTARESGAYNCAPAELAMAETNVEFAEDELDQGNFFRAKEHVRIAESNARQAVRLSPSDRCLAAAATTGVAKGIDSDGDGIPDALDRCPVEPEDRDGFQDSDGCPDPDNDQDGILDVKDLCPNVAEDHDGFQDDDGCPDPDNDQDGVPDSSDKCPGEKEDRDGFADDDGCPDPDNDKDGVPDVSDRCPDEAGVVGNAGCPQKFTLIAVASERIEIKQPLAFAKGKATLLPQSHAILAEVVAALKGRPSLRVRVDGHTDSIGKRLTNLRLSQARADAVGAYLVSQGIASDRVETKGFGPDEPIETNKTAAGRERNRRVEFVILNQ